MYGNKHAFIDQASVNGSDKIVTIDTEHDKIPSAWLVASWVCPPGLCQISKNYVQWVTPGIWVGAKLVGADSGSFDAFGAGVSVHLACPNAQGSPDFGCGWSMGVGWVTHNLKTLQNGIEEGKPLPPQFTQIQYKNRSVDGILLMVTIPVGQTGGK
jgi:hypothetical protein